MWSGDHPDSVWRGSSWCPISPCFSSNHPEKRFTHLLPMSCGFTSSGEPRLTSKLAFARLRLSECRSCRIVLSRFEVLTSSRGLIWVGISRRLPWASNTEHRDRLSSDMCFTRFFALGDLRSLPNPSWTPCSSGALAPIS